MNRKQDIKTIVILIIIGIILFGIVGSKFYYDFISDGKSNKEIDKIELYGYSLNKNDTDIYSKLISFLSLPENQPFVYEVWYDGY